MIKSGKVTECSFSSEWKAPNGDIIYFHQIKIDNGDYGAVGTSEKLPSKINVGMVINYSVPGIGKIKLENSAPTPQASGGYGDKKTGSKGGYSKKPEDYLGYSYSYAKDLVIAGKTKPADIKALKSIAEEIYQHIQELLNNENK